MFSEPAGVRGEAPPHEDDGNPLLFRIDMRAAHGGPSGRYDALRDLAFDYAFVLGQLGLAGDVNAVGGSSV
jgi:oligopeptidase B